MLKAKAIAFPFKLDFLNTFFVTCTNHLKGVFVRKLKDFFKQVFFMRSSVFFRITVDFYVVPIAINP